MLTKVWGGWAATVARLALVSAMAALGVSTEARAADDGQAPLWQGLGTIVGIGKSDDANIDYRERSKLVLPPKMDLPPPRADAHPDAAWPVDQDVERIRKLKIAKERPAFKSIGKLQDSPITRQPGVVPGVVTMSATTGAGPGGAACLKDGIAVACPEQPVKAADHPTRQLEWNPLTWVGVQKKADIVLGPEPDRDFLTDPPPGFRAPAEGVGAKVQNN